MSGSQSDHTPQNQRGGGFKPEPGRGDNLSDQRQGAVRGAADTASELWDEAYEQGERYYRQGSQMLGNVDGTTLSGWLIAGAVGLGLGWLLFGSHSNDMTRRMSQSSDDHPRRGSRNR